MLRYSVAMRGGKAKVAIESDGRYIFPSECKDLLDKKVAVNVGVEFVDLELLAREAIRCGWEEGSAEVQLPFEQLEMHTIAARSLQKILNLKDEGLKHKLLRKLQRLRVSGRANACQSVTASPS